MGCVRVPQSYTVLYLSGCWSRLSVRLVLVARQPQAAQSSEAQRLRQRCRGSHLPALERNILGCRFTPRDRRRALLRAVEKLRRRSTFRPPSCCSEGSPSEPPSELRASPRSPPGTAAASAPNSAPRLRWPPNQCTTISWCARREKQSAPSLVKALLAHTAAPMLSCANCECPRHPHRPHSRCQPCS